MSSAGDFSTMQMTVRFGLIPPIFWENPFRDGPEPSTSLPFLLTTQEDVQIDEYLKRLMPRRHYTFTNTHVFSRNRIQALRPRSQCRLPVNWMD
ncbi:hypothetical protein TNCV_4125211 [Trichonephila clavipes]|nr:hypothetical protein TNCV_4125211 [Trichonephila clavipes]